MENYEPEALEDWRLWRRLSIEKYASEYDRLNVHFDVYTGESEVSQEGMQKAVAKLEELGLVEESNGAKLIDLEKHGLGKAVIRKRGRFLSSLWNIKLLFRCIDGTSIYLTRDIGGTIERMEKYKPDKMIWVVSSQQDLHLAQFFKILELMGYPWAKDLVHINYGLVQGMSTRKGTVVFLEQIIQEATRSMHEVMQKNEEKYNAVEDPEMTSREIGITGIKIQDMAAKRYISYLKSLYQLTDFYY